MASLRRHPRSPYFIACFLGDDGKRYQRSTGIRSDGTIASRREAQKIADGFEDVARRQQTARQVQRVFHEIYKEVTGETLPDQSAKKFSADWLKDKKGAVTPRTHRFYQSKLDSFLLQLGRRANTPIFQITESDIRTWRDEESKRVSRSTANHGLKVLRMMFGDAKKRNLISHNPAEMVPVLKKERQETPRRPFSLSELSTLLAGVEGEWRSLILFGLYTGQRLGDLARMRWSAVDLESMEIRFTTGKTGRNQKIPICQPLLSHIQSLSPFGRPVDPVHPEAFHLHESEGKSSTLSRQFHDLMAKVGLVGRRPHRKKLKEPGDHRRVASDLTFHSFRHTLTSMLKNAGVSASIAEEIVGHDSAEMNRVYTHLENQTLKDAMSRLPNLIQMACIGS